MGTRLNPTFDYMHGVHLEGNAVLLGEDVDGAAGLRQRVEVDLQAHGGSCTDGTDGLRKPALASAGDSTNRGPQSSLLVTLELSRPAQLTPVDLWRALLRRTLHGEED